MFFNNITEKYIEQECPTLQIMLHTHMYMHLCMYAVNNRTESSETSPLEIACLFLMVAHFVAVLFMRFIINTASLA